MGPFRNTPASTLDSEQAVPTAVIMSRMSAGSVSADVMCMGLYPGTLRIVYQIANPNGIEGGFAEYHLVNFSAASGFIPYINRCGGAD